MSERFDTTSEEHLQRLLDTSARLIAQADPLSLRLATMCVVDYYQAILRESASKVGLDLSSEKDLAGMLNRLRTRVLGLDRISLDDLSRARNTTYHNEFRYHVAAELGDFMAKGPKRRKFLLDASEAAVRHERVMASAVQCLLATANEMRRELRTGSKEWRVHWLPKVERAFVLAASSPHALEPEGLDLLLDLTRQVASSKAIDAMNQPNEGDADDSGYEPYDEPESAEDAQADYEPEPDTEPTEFDPSDYYPDESESEPPDMEPPEDGPADHES